MEQYIIPAILIIGIIFAVVITRWINWFAWGENRSRKQAAQQKRRERLKKGAGDKVNEDE